MTLMTVERPLNMALEARLMIYSNHNDIISLARQSLNLAGGFFDNIYNLPSRISDYNEISGIIISDVLENPMSSDGLSVLDISRTKHSDSRGLVATIN
jgi:hypothetical protein